jgi:hypothetical protein
MNKPLETLMQKEMTRKEFLTTVAFGTATILGLGGILKFFGKGNNGQQVSAGYGMSAYGGSKK